MNKALKITITSKSSLTRAMDALAVIAPEFSSAGTKIFLSMVNMAAALDGVHGRSTQAREGVLAIEKARKQLLAAETGGPKQAPKKGTKSAPKKKGTNSAKPKKTPEEIEAGKAERAEATRVRRAEKAAARYGDEEAVSKQGFCLCGCGGVPNVVEMRDGSLRTKLFIAGHDAKLRGKATAVAAGHLSRKVLGKYSRDFLARSTHFSDELRAALDIEPAEFEDGTPRCWEDFAAELRSA